MQRGKLRNFLSITLSMALVFGSFGLPVSHAAGKYKVKRYTKQNHAKNVKVKKPVKHWASATLAEWANRGWLKVNGANLAPDKQITRAEFMSLVNKMQGYTTPSSKIYNYKDVKASDWFYNDVAAALQAGYISGTSASTISPNSPVTREQVMAVFTRILKVRKDNDLYRQAADANQVSDWAKQEVSTCVKEGYIIGNKGRLLPKSNMTVAQAVVMLNRKYTNTRYFGFRGKYDLSGMKVNNATILSDGVVLKNAKVQNNVTIAKSVGEGDVTLNMVGIAGNLYVQGGGSSSIHMKNSTVKGDAIVEKNFGQPVRLVAEGMTKINNAVMKSAAKVENQTKSSDAFNKVVIDPKAGKGKLALEGNFAKVENNLKNANIKVTGTVKQLELNADTVMTGKPVIKELQKSENAAVKVADESGKVVDLPQDSKSFKMTATGLDSSNVIDETEIAGDEPVVDMFAKVDFNSAAPVTMSDLPKEAIAEMDDKSDLAGLMPALPQDVNFDNPDEVANVDFNKMPTMNEDGAVYDPSTGGETEVDFENIDNVDFDKMAPSKEEVQPGNDEVTDPQGETEEPKQPEEPNYPYDEEEEEDDDDEDEDQASKLHVQKTEACSAPGKTKITIQEALPTGARRVYILSSSKVKDLKTTDTMVSLEGDYTAQAFTSASTVIEVANNKYITIVESDTSSTNVAKYISYPVSGCNIKPKALTVSSTGPGKVANSSKISVTQNGSGKLVYELSNNGVADVLTKHNKGDLTEIPTDKELVLTSGAGTELNVYELNGEGNVVACGSVAISGLTKRAADLAVELEKGTTTGSTKVRVLDGATHYKKGEEASPLELDKSYSSLSMFETVSVGTEINVNVGDKVTFYRFESNKLKAYKTIEITSAMVDIATLTMNAPTATVETATYAGTSVAAVAIHLDRNNTGQMNDPARNIDVKVGTTSLTKYSGGTFSNDKFVVQDNAVDNTKTDLLIPVGKFTNGQNVITISLNGYNKLIVVITENSGTFTVN